MSSPEAWGLFLHLWGVYSRIPWQDSAYFPPVQGFPRFSSLVLCCGLAGGAGARQGGFLRIFVPIVGGNVYF